MKKLFILLLLVAPCITKANLYSWQINDALVSLPKDQYLKILFSPTVVTLYYTSNSGSNSNNGLSPAFPWQTLSKVSSSQGSLNPGDYVLFNRNDVFTGSLSVSVSGSAGNPITFGSYGTGNLPAFTGTGSTISQLFYVNNHDYITFQELQIYDPLIDTTIRSIAGRNVLSKIQIAFNFDNASDHCVIQSCKVWAVGALLLSNGASNGFHTIQNNYVADLTMIKDDVGNGDDDYGANTFVIQTQSNQILHNIFKRCYAHSTDYTVDGGGDFVVAASTDNNIIMYNYFDSCIGVVEMKGNFTGLIVAYNIMTNCGQSFTFQTGNQSLGVYNNCFVETSTEMPGQAGQVFAGMGSGDAATVKNNLFWLVNGVDGFSSSTGITSHQYNGNHVSGGSTYGLTLSTGEFTSSPNFWLTQSGPSNTWNYYLSSTSSAIGAGVIIVGISQTDIYGNSIGNPPNAGAVGSVSVVVSNQIVLPTYINNHKYGYIH